MRALSMFFYTTTNKYLLEESEVMCLKFLFPPHSSLSSIVRLIDMNYKQPKKKTSMSKLLPQFQSPGYTFLSHYLKTYPTHNEITNNLDVYISLVYSRLERLVHGRGGNCGQAELSFLIKTLKPANTHVVAQQNHQSNRFWTKTKTSEPALKMLSRFP